VASGSLSLVACATLVASGCSVGDDVISGMGLSQTESGSVASGLQSIPQPSATESEMVVTPQQQGYLDALAASGVRPTSKLAALSIGSYVCQARAAHQTDQAVWDFVLPMVRGDVRDMQASSASAAVLPSGEVNSVTADYIRIATEKLC
jgi:hypothetical protein